MKADELLNEELDIIKIIKSIRLIKKDQEKKFIINLSENDDDQNIS